MNQNFVPDVEKWQVEKKPYRPILGIPRFSPAVSATIQIWYKKDIPADDPG